MTRVRIALVVVGIGIATLVAGPVGSEGRQKKPVYVGARVCATCHDGPGMGHQFSRWLRSRHAGAFASLAKPGAREMAELSGVPVEPVESPLCLGCHATAADAEGWEKDPTFHIEDGVQCEFCHGPGSEYMDAAVMSDREAAMRAGLRMPERRTCNLCHYEKGSHVAIHQLPKLDMDWAWKELAHPTPGTPEPDGIALPEAASRDGEQEPAGPDYVGVMACAACHRGRETGFQFSRWRLSGHATAWADLATPAAVATARKEGVNGDPQGDERCLRCHTSPRSPFVTEGVGCEACHGPGSDYVAEAIMRDPRAAAAGGLQPVIRETCLPCHEDAHGKSFDFETAVEAIAHPTGRVKRAEGPRYKTPVNLSLTPDGRELWIACEASSSVIVVDVARRSKAAEIPVGGQPNDVAFSPDGRTAYVSNRLDDTVTVLDVASHQPRTTIPVGDEPHGLLTNRSGKLLYVLNTAEDALSVIDTATLEEVKRLSTGRNPWSLALSPDGERILATNNLSRFVEFRTPSVSEVTVIDAERGVVEHRAEVPETNLLQGVTWHPGGEYGLITMNRTKNLVPMTRILQGWTITNGMGIVWSDGRVDQVLLDEPNMHFPDAADVAITPDGRLALVTSSGSDRVAVVDLAKLISMLDEATPDERTRIFPDHLGKSTDFVIAHVPTPASPRGVVASNDGRVAFVANALDDSVTVIDLERLEAVERIDLGGSQEITQVRWGERLFHSANIAFQRQFSCHSCHPDGHVDSVTYDIEPDGIGLNPVDNRTLRGILDTAPFKWEGTNPTLSRQCGPRLAVFFTRIQPFAPDELAAVDAYIRTIPRPPNRYRPLGARLTEAQRRGKAMFERTRTNSGTEIAVDDRCVTCHFPPLYTDRSRRDVGTRMPLDIQGDFDVPHLSNIYDSAPYLHNGISPSLEEIWTRYNPEDRHGVTNDMTKDQLNDLIEYLKTL